MSLDILAPPIMRMSHNRCYRVNLVHEDFGGHPQKLQQSAPVQPQQNDAQIPYVEQDFYGQDDDDADENEVCALEELANGKFKLDMRIAQSFYGGIIGAKGSTKKRIEQETKTEIFVPRNFGHRRKEECVTITGKSAVEVRAARRQILLLLSSLRNRMRPTHFYCVPFTNTEVIAKYAEFKQQVLSANFPGIEEDLFVKNTFIHLTLSVCVLLDENERKHALDLLQSCRQYATELAAPFDIEVSGLEIMNDDPSAVHVLYARVKSPQLQKFADHLHAKSLRSGLGKVESFSKDHVKLHMTLLNASNAEKAKNTGKYTKFDAREILKRYGDFHFGKVQCNELQLCAMGSKEGLDFYKITGSLKF